MSVRFLLDSGIDSVSSSTAGSILNADTLHSLGTQMINSTTRDEYMTGLLLLENDIERNLQIDFLRRE
ncbi:Hypothetical predicted protein [Olea europaea subsp. europaea]|uniref:Uncharacterized protein n=2 Tax=Olea europaea subsp. europaea TaxID=158383 RepID=A0A8S0T1A9_OLEEU|nr:Hypothetical predicted protein [Olea europaea subsp. europaea]